MVSKTRLHPLEKTRRQRNRELVERRVVLHFVDGIRPTKIPVWLAGDGVVGCVTPWVAEHDSVASVAAADAVGVAADHGVALV